jgi:hypothetical protein
LADLPWAGLPVLILLQARKFFCVVDVVFSGERGSNATTTFSFMALYISTSREAIADVGKIAVTGFCLGGTLSYGAAANLPGFSVAVGYYGGHIVRMVDQSPKIPTMLHFGELDTHIPMSDVETIKSKQPSVEVYTYKADHGFQRGEYNIDTPRRVGNPKRRIWWIDVRIVIGDHAAKMHGIAPRRLFGGQTVGIMRLREGR